MKLSCKCGNILTNDLYPTKKWEKVVTETVVEEGSYNYGGVEVGDVLTHVDFQVRKGSFLLASQQFRSFYNRDENAFLVSPLDLFDQEQLKYQRGYGCCGNHWKSYNCPSCGTQVGEQKLDCYDDKHVSFDFSKVVRVYK